MSDRDKAGVYRGSKFGDGRGRDCYFAGIRRKFKADDRQFEFILLFRLLRRGNGLAQTARVQSIERTGHGCRHRLGSHVIRQHQRPRHRLQRRPVQPRRQNEGDHDQEFSGST